MTKHASPKVWAGLGVYNGRRYSTNVPPGGASPALGHAGYDFDFNDGDGVATASRMVIDLRMPANTLGNKVWVSTAYGPPGQFDRVPTATYVEGGGYYQGGCIRFVPGSASGNEVDDPRHEFMCGIGEIYGLNAVSPGGACRKLSIGVLVRFGPTYWSAGGSGGKPIIVARQDALRRDNGQPRNTRPMVISDAHNDPFTRRGMGPHDGTIGNWTTDGAGTDYWNEASLVNQVPLAGQAQWFQMEVDLEEPYDEVEDEPIGQVRTLLWDEGGTFHPVLRKNLYEDVGGTMPHINTIMGWCSSAPVVDSGYWYDVERIEIWAGESTGMTPPYGFPGSAR